MCICLGQEVNMHDAGILFIRDSMLFLYFKVRYYMNEIVKSNEKVITDMYREISNVITSNKSKMFYQINNNLVKTNFMIGKIIVENEQNGKIPAEYGKDVLKRLSKKLTNKFGSGYIRSGLQNMRLFYNKYKNCKPLAGRLSWSHYCYLIYMKMMVKDSFMKMNVINLNDQKEN